MPTGNALQEFGGRLNVLIHKAVISAPNGISGGRRVRQEQPESSTTAIGKRGQRKLGAIQYNQFKYSINDLIVGVKTTLLFTPMLQKLEGKKD